MRALLLSLLLFFSISSMAKADVYYCNATAVIGLSFHETPDQPIDVRRIDPANKTMKFKREKQHIVLKTDRLELTIPILKLRWSPNNVKDHFVASTGAAGSGALEFSGLNDDEVGGYLEYSDGLVIFDNGWRVISTFKCDKF